jgi:hypothetical protein
MTITFRPAARESVGLLIGLAGASGSGKTWSAMELAKGLSGGNRFAVIDTEAGRAKHYADQFAFDHADLGPPFRPEAYADAITTAEEAGYGVIVIDSFSHEHAGDGGLLDWHQEEFERLGSRDAVKMTAWIKPKMAHRRMVSRLLQVRSHLILCFRAQESVEIVKVDGKTVIRPTETLTGLDGWKPISERTLPYELTLSFLLTPDAPGVPKPIKLQDQHKAFVPLDRPLGPDVGAALQDWARGGTKQTAAEKRERSVQTAELEEQLLALAETLGKSQQVEEAIDRARQNPDGFHDWLQRQTDLAREAVSQKEDE